MQTNPPRFSAYVASKAALDAWTRVVGSETIGDNVHFTTIHMPLVRTPMIAPTKIYDSFPTISPDEAADLICEAIRAKPKQIDTRLGTFGEVAYALFPKAVDQILSTAYKVFPDSRRRQGPEGPRGARLDRAGRARAPDARRALVGPRCQGRGASVAAVVGLVLAGAGPASATTLTFSPSPQRRPEGSSGRDFGCIRPARREAMAYGSRVGGSAARRPTLLP